MKLQQLEQDNKLSNNNLKTIIIPIIIGIIMVFSSCEKNSIEIINTFTHKLDAPTISIINTEIIYSENAKIKSKVKSKEINRYLNVENPYTEFPKGIYVEFYDSTQKVTSFIKANYCIFDETEQLWTAKNNVVSVSEDGDTLNTEFLIWDQQKQKIYSDQYVRITNKEGVIHGKGFEANQDFSNWKIKHSTGTFNVQHEKQAK